MPENQNIQAPAPLKKELQNILKEKYLSLFLEKLGSVDSVLTAIGGRYKKYEEAGQKEQMKEVFKELFNENVSEEIIIVVIKKLAQGGNPLERFKHFFGNTDKPDSRDQALSSRTRFILDAVCFEVTADIEECLSKFISDESVTEQILERWDLLLKDFPEYADMYNDMVKQGSERSMSRHAIIQNCVMARITDYVEQCIRNPLLGQWIKIDENGFVLEENGALEAKGGGYKPMIDNNFVSLQKDSLTINPNIFAEWIKKNGQPTPERVEVIDKKIEELFSSQLWNQEPVSGYKVWDALKIGGILGSSGGVGAGAGALAGAFLLPAGIATAAATVSGGSMLLVGTVIGMHRLVRNQKTSSDSVKQEEPSVYSYEKINAVLAPKQRELREEEDLMLSSPVAEEDDKRVILSGKEDNPQDKVAEADDEWMDLSDEGETLVRIK